MNTPLSREPVIVKDIVPGPNNSSPRYLTNVNDTLYFTIYDRFRNKWDLWKSDGTETGTIRFKNDINLGVPISSIDFIPSYPINVNGNLYFSHNDGITGSELWKTDGTEAGTKLVKDTNPGPQGSSPASLTNVNGILYFTAYDSTHGQELWKLDTRTKDYTTNGLKGVYYDNLNFTGPSVSQINPTLDFSWGQGSPSPSIGVNTFSARWTGQVQAQYSEDYTFYTQTDDGVRLWVNDQLLIDNWTDHSLTENNGTISLVAGQKYNIQMEYYDKAVDATAKLLWSSPSTAKTVIPQAQLYGDIGDGLKAEYYDNLNFTGTSVTKVDPILNYNWGQGNPTAGIGADTFSVRWTGQVQTQYSEDYTFYTQSDDGVRLWVNDKLLIDNWTDHGLTENQGTIQLAADQQYNIKMEYYDNAVDATAKLLWSSPSTAKDVIPQTQLYSNTFPIGDSLL